MTTETKWRKPEDAPEDTWVLTITEGGSYHIAARYEHGWETLDGRRVSVDAWMRLPPFDEVTP